MSERTENEEIQDTPPWLYMAVHGGDTRAMRWKLACGISLLALSASGLANVGLFRGTIAQIHEKFEIQLDPTNERRFVEDNRALAPPPPGARRVVFVGDSHIERWKELPEVGGAQLVNRGWSGETTAQELLRLERDVIALAPSVVVIELGSNDTKCVGLFPGEGERIASSCHKNLSLLVERLLERDVRVVFLTLFPVGEPDLAHRMVWSGAAIHAMISAQEKINQAFVAMKTPGLTVIDSDPVLAVGGRLNPSYTVDGTHLNQAGYRALNGAVKPVLEAALATSRGAR